MNVDIFQTVLESSRAAWSCAVTMGGVLSPELLCSVTVNSVFLFVVLWGAVRLVASRQRGESRKAPRNGGECC